MARESSTPTDPVTPGKPRELPTGRSLQPEFGKPSPLRPAYPHNNSSGNPFNIPKANRPRPEHHRSQQQSRPQNPPQHGVQSSAYRPTIPPVVTSTPRRNEPFDPFKPVRPSAYNPNRSSRPVDNDVVEIRRPENISFNTPRAPKAFYSSKPSAMKPNYAVKNLQNFVDLTSGGGFSPAPVYRGGAVFGSTGGNDYVDTAQANENIKALLEGAFEDEDAKQPKSKGKNQKRGGKKKKSKKGGQAESKAEREASEIDDLAAQLQGVSVNEPSNNNSKTVETTPAAEKSITGSDKEDSKVDQDASEEGSENETDGEGEEDDEEDDGTVEGLEVQLLPHQRQGVNWMCEKETGNRNARGEVKGVLPKGGILADDMGLGKTVQAIALMLLNPKPSNGRRRLAKTQHKDDSEASEDEETKSVQLPPGLSKSTLVVAPLALIKQWESEIKSKVEDAHKLRVLVYHGTARTKSTGSLEDYDVVITTYGTLTSDHGAFSKANKKTGLFSVYWYRIILDEAHTIKNRNAKATQAAYALDAEYRWCLSGTPMQNNLDELQSLIRFLRIKPYNDLAAWKDQITRPLANGRGGLAIERLQVVLKAFMKRRTKDVLKLNNNLKPGEGNPGDGKKKSPGFQITKREVIKVAVEFMPGELNFYKRLEQRTENSLEKMMGDSKLDYAGALVLLLRLRQSCNHPDLVKSDLAKDKDILLQGGNPSSQSGPEKQNDLDAMADLFGTLSVVSKKCDICQMDLSKEESAAGGSRCNQCETDFNGNSGTNRRHRKSSKEVVDLTRSPSGRPSEARVARVQRNRKVVMDSDDEDDEDGEWIVPENKRTALSLGTAGGSDDEDAEGGGEWIGSEDSETDNDGPETPSRRLAKKSSREEESEDDIYLNPGDDDNRVLPSTKIRHLMKILRRESADHKFIVFSFFTSMLDKVEPFLKRAGVGFARYDGSMPNNLREASLDKLRYNKATRVLLCSLRAGALGLNLTAASRVVILEPFWNPFVEEQAIDRVHRLNQTLDVKIYKMIIQGSVEERILDLQDRKRELANVTIEGKTAAAKLTMKDMLALFGKDAESRYNNERGNVEPSQRGGLLVSSNEASQRSGDAWDSSRDQNRKPEKKIRGPEDSVYGRRW